MSSRFWRGGGIVPEGTRVPAFAGAGDMSKADFGDLLRLPIQWRKKSANGFESPRTALDLAG